jgi:hypothetical protein
MASIPYRPDPYQGWRVWNDCGNVTAHQIMTDTSGQWQLAADYGCVRIYERR